MESAISIQTNDGYIHVGKDGYGELFIIFKGPRGGERGYDKITKDDAKKLRDFLVQWIGE